MFGVKPFPFGSCLVTSVGMMGLDVAFAPFTPFARVPILVMVGAIREKPVVVDGEVPSFLPSFLPSLLPLLFMTNLDHDSHDPGNQNRSLSGP